MKPGPCLRCAGILSLLTYGALAWTSHHYTPFPLGFFGSLIGLIWFFFGFVALKASRNASTGSASPASLRELFIWAISFRLVSFFAIPIYEDDFYRYLWDGWQLVTTGSPYGTRPSDFFGNQQLPEIFQTVLDHINYPGVPTIYGPVLQLFFGAASLLGPGQLLSWKLVLFAVELSALFFFYQLRQNEIAQKKEARTSQEFSFLLYSWCPLLIFETGFNAHADIVGITLLFFAWSQRNHPSCYRMPLLLALALGCKWFALFFAPYLLWEKKLRFWLVFASALFFIYLPFLLQGNKADVEGLVRMGQLWEFNSLGYALLKDIMNSPASRHFSLGLSGAGMLVLWNLWRCKRIPLEAAFQAAMAWFLIWSPVLNPWYLLWLLPWAALRPSWTVWSAFAAVFFSYCTRMNLSESGPGLFEHPVWVRPLEALLILGGVALDLHPAGFLKKKKTQKGSE